MTSLWHVDGSEWSIPGQEISQLALVLDLHRLVAAQPAITSPRDALARLTPAGAAVSWWDRWQSSMIHAALQAEAAMADVGPWTGLDHGEVVRQWQRRADVQTRMDIGGRPAINVVEVCTVRGRLASGANR